MNKNYIVITGNPGDGFEYYGPFESMDDAATHATEFPAEICEWWIVALIPPTS
tara:strand:+ start:735 stop:893 length:159 start_codon:yes stop_codon:yes gene_type:complete